MEVTHEFVDKDYFHIRYVGGDFCNYCKNCCVDHQRVICSCLGVCSYRNSSANISCNSLIYFFEPLEKEIIKAKMNLEI